MAEKERNEAIMGSIRSWIVGQEVGNVWKAKYIKERKKVARLWRSYCAIKYPDNVHCGKATSSTPVGCGVHYLRMCAGTQEVGNQFR